MKLKMKKTVSRVKKAAAAMKNFSEVLRATRRVSPYALAATAAGIWLPKADAATLVNLDVTSAANYPIGSTPTTITNTGSLIGDFVSSGAIVAGVSNIDGVGAVAMLDVPGAGATGGRSY